MRRRLLCLVCCLLLGGHFLVAQEARLYFIRDRDTLSVEKMGLKVFLEFRNHFLLFNQADRLIYPPAHEPDSVLSIRVVLGKDTLSFFNLPEMLRQSSLPPEIIRRQVPFYQSVFADRRNMYFAIDHYPYEEDDRRQADETGKDGTPRHLTLAELYYQAREIQALAKPVRRR